MQKILLETEAFPKQMIPEKLKEHRISVNHHAEMYFEHPSFRLEPPVSMTVAIASLKEIGFADGADLRELFREIPQKGLMPCPACTGLFLRMAWKDQRESLSTVLSGTHEVPDQAVTVLSQLLEEREDFPRGLYLRRVQGVLWLRGYVCDLAYRFPGEAMFAFAASPVRMLPDEKAGPVSV